MRAPAVFARAALLATGFVGVTGVRADPPPAAPPAPPAAAPSLEHDVLYGNAGGQDLRLDVARPAAAGLFPAVVWFHGGGWQKGSKAEGAGRLLALAEHGYVALSADYRLAPASKFPAAIEDASCAVRFVRAKASAWGVNPSKIGVWGEGEGAYLAMMLGVLGEKEGYDGMGGHLEQSRSVQAVVSFFGPSDLSKWSAWTGAEPYLRQLYGKGSAGLLIDFLGSNDRRAPVFSIASPLTHVSAGDAPVLSVHGENDPVVPIEQAKAYHAALRGAGVRERLVVVPGGAHGFGGAEKEKADAEALQFFDEILKGTRAAAPTAAPASTTTDASPPPTAANGPRIDADIVYRRVPGLDLHLDLVRPATGAGPFPLAVAFHFGPYAPRARLELRDELLWYAANGFAAASVEYRGPVKGAYPTPVEDGRASLAFLRAHAGDYGLDPARVAVVGRNLGGWVALHLALATPSEGAARPQAAVVGYAPTDLGDSAFDDNPNIGRLREVLVGVKASKDAILRASPLHYADKGDPPVFLFHNPGDIAIPFAQSDRLVAALQAAGCDATLERLTGGGHGADRAPQTAGDAADFERIHGKTLEFLRRVLKVEGPATPR